jgi:hypothetical protein
MSIDIDQPENMMFQILDTSIGSINELDKKVIDKLSFIAMKQVVGHVIHLTLRNTKILPEQYADITSKVYTTCVEKGLLPHKEKGVGNAYTVFCKEQRELYKDKYAGKSIGEQSKELSSLWKTISNEEKEKYKQISKSPASTKTDKTEKKSTKSIKSTNKSTHHKEIEKQLDHLFAKWSIKGNEVKGEMSEERLIELVDDVSVIDGDTFTGFYKVNLTPLTKSLSIVYQDNDGNKKKKIPIAELSSDLKKVYDYISEL